MDATQTTKEIVIALANEGMEVRDLLVRCQHFGGHNVELVNKLFDHATLGRDRQGGTRSLGWVDQTGGLPQST